MSGITVGDLVEVAYGMRCCGGTTGCEGMYFVVASIRCNIHAICKFCGAQANGDEADGLPGRGLIYMPRLRKIPPLWELDETEHKEELPA